MRLVAGAVFFCFASGICVSLLAEERKPPSLEEKVRSLEEQVEELRRVIGDLKAQLESEKAPEASPIKAPAVAEPADGADEFDDPGTFKAYWKEGIRMDSADGAAQLKVGGRIMNDWAFFAGNSDFEERSGPLHDGTEFRSGRLYFSGQIYERAEFKSEFEFAGGQVELKDIFIGLKKLPVGDLKMGHFKEPMGLEQLTSRRFITFMERALPMLFSPDRNVGVMLQNRFQEERLNWSAGFFMDTDNQGSGDTSKGGYSFSTRLTGLPVYRESGRKLLHLGASFSHRSHQDGQLRYSERIEAHLAPSLVDTGRLQLESENLLGLEAALVAGPLSVQSEYLASFVNSDALGDPTFSGFYLQGSFFLTGEQRRYSKSYANFDRTRPQGNFLGEEPGPGAWEIAARFSRIDLSDQAVAGGELKGFTLGLNWYLNPNTRFMWNYVFGDEETSGSVNVLQTRFQLDF